MATNPTAGGLGAPLVLADLRSSPRRRRSEQASRAIFVGAAAISILISALIVLSLVGEAWQFLREVDLGNLWSIGWFPRRELFDVKTIIVGSLIVTGIAIVIAGPLGLGAAIYLSEYATPRVRAVVKPALEILAGIPSVVLGFFAIAFIAPNIVQEFFGGNGPFSLLAGGIGVGILVIPLVASVSEDALRAVPQSLREASVGLGARKIETTLRVVVPAAVSGLVAAAILAISRAIGETMVVAIASGATGGSLYSTSPSKPGQTMTAAMASLASGTDQVRGGSNAYQSLFFVGLVLFVITLVLNLAASRFVARVRQRY